MGEISDSDLYVAIVSALVAAVLSAGTTVIFFGLEERRSRRERRAEYFLDSASDLADRIWNTLRALRAHGHQATPWSEVRRTALVLRAGLLGQTPRYRVAGVEAASEAVTAWLGSFVGYWAGINGRDRANRELLERLKESGVDPSVKPMEGSGQHQASPSFTTGDLDAAMLQVYSDSLDMLEELILGTLAVLSSYSPGEGALQVPQPEGLWPDYSAALVAAASRGRGQATPD